MHRWVRLGLTLSGLRARGRRNALDIRVRRNEVALRGLPSGFDGYTVLHLSDLHLDVGPEFVTRLVHAVRGLSFDACVLTGDFRFRSFGPYARVLDALQQLRPYLGATVFAVLGNHDTIRMVPGMERQGIRVLMNESVLLHQGADTLPLAGIDDAHYFRTHNFHKSLADVAHDACVVLLSHTPEPYRQAAHAGVSLMLCGHTHGGQICLPGGIPVLTDSDAPRALARGAWSYHGMAGYTSVGCGTSIVDVRLNCLPEVTLHHLSQV